MNNKGFTLLELMVVIAIIGILASISLPSYQTYIYRSEVVDALSMASDMKVKVTEYYSDKLEFPADNEAAGLPEAEYLIGNRITKAVVQNGAIHITLGNKVKVPLQGKILTFRPAVVSGSPTSPLSWLCGYDEAVSGMEAQGNNKTDISQEYLPSACRGE